MLINTYKHVLYHCILYILFNSLYKFSNNCVVCRYLREPDALGTAGGLYHFRDTILAPLDNSNGSEGEQVQAFFVMNGDVCADFPLDEMLDMHFNNQLQHQQKQPVLITVMATETTRQQSVHYGMLNNFVPTWLYM